MLNVMRLLAEKGIGSDVREEVDDSSQLQFDE
jgi:hypothetical protein